MSAPHRPPSPLPFPPIDWERWVGLRGAAILGGIAFALAGLLFFQYSIQHGLITPSMRVVIGTLTGLGCLVGSEWIRTRGFRITAEAVSGAGIVILYAAFWAAHSLYGLIGLGAAFALMVLVTAACCLLSLRHSSQVTAALGLAGGFATPLLLHSDVDRPFGLFGYVLLLDLALLVIAQRRRWPQFALLSLLGTAVMQVLWISERMGPERLALGLGILGVFAVLFAMAGTVSAPEERGKWLLTQSGAVLIPFVFTLYFASEARFGPHLYPIAILLGLLSAAAGWIGRKQEAPWLGIGASSAVVMVVGVWISQRPIDSAMAWEAVGISVALAVLFHLFVEWDRERPGMDGPAPAAMIVACGLLILLALAGMKPPGTPLWPWLAGWLALSALLYRHATFPERAALQVFAALTVAAGLTVFHFVRHGDPVFPGPSLFFGVLAAVSILAQIPALLQKDLAVRRLADHAAAALPVALLVPFINAPILRTLSPSLLLGVGLLLAILAVLAATRLASGVWFAAAVGATALVHLAWTFQRLGLAAPASDPAAAAAAAAAAASAIDTSRALAAAGWTLAPGFARTESGILQEAVIALGLQILAVVIFTAWPFLARAFKNDRWAWYASALAGPVWFWSLKRLFEIRFGDDLIAILPLALGAISLAAATRVRDVWPAGDPLRKSALVWFSAVALGFVSVAIPLQLEKEWITIGWALEGLAVIALWKRLDHPGLKYFGLTLLGCVTARLIFNPAVLGYYPRPGWRVVNWLLYTYLVPAAAMLGSSALLRELEAVRLRSWEEPAYHGRRPYGAILTSLAGILVVFVWINLAIADWFAAGPNLTISWERMPARDLTVSIAWAIYALILLGLGMARSSQGLRWLSLSFLVLTIGKVFLYDLGELRDLYRVASMAGLAVSLIMVSLLYQRFVFRERRRGAQ